MKKMTLSVISMILMTVCATTAQAAVPAQNRALVIVTDLDTHGVQELVPLYTVLEDIGAGLPQMPVLRNQYREIHVLRNNRATLGDFRALALSLSGRAEIRAIDVFLMLHGQTDRLVFADRRYTMEQMTSFMNTRRDAREAARVLVMQRKLRLMYNTSCFGASHRAAFRSIGFDAVVGSIAVNANSEVEFPAFLGLWNAGARLSDAFAPSNNPVALAAADGPLRATGQIFNNFLKHVDSRKVFSGNTAITISTDAQ